MDILAENLHMQEVKADDADKRVKEQIECLNAKVKRLETELRKVNQEKLDQVIQIEVLNDLIHRKESEGVTNGSCSFRADAKV
jgi:hypothetical protein